MGNPNWSYEKMVRELDRLTTNSKKIDETTSIDQIEKRIRGYEHNSEFYFNCGKSYGNVMNDILSNDGMDSFNVALGGFSMFKDLVELKD